VRYFKFLSDNDDVPLDEIVLHEEYDGASWMYGRRENLDQYPHEIVVEYHNGIHSFLNNFPPGFIACILSITGPNGRIHTDDTEYDDGWGFDITNDLIGIEWVRFTH
jgi:hypothetical protein